MHRRMPNRTASQGQPAEVEGSGDPVGLPASIVNPARANIEAAALLYYQALRVSDIGGGARRRQRRPEQAPVVDAGWMMAPRGFGTMLAMFIPDRVQHTCIIGGRSANVPLRIMPTRISARCRTSPEAVARRRPGLARGFPGLGGPLLPLSAANLQLTASHLLDPADRVGCDRAHRAKQKGIRTKSLRFLDSGLRKQVITGGRKRTGIGFRHQ